MNYFQVSKIVPLYSLYSVHFCCIWILLCTCIHAALDGCSSLSCLHRIIQCKLFSYLKRGLLHESTKSIIIILFDKLHLEFNYHYVWTFLDHAFFFRDCMSSATTFGAKLECMRRRANHIITASLYEKIANINIPYFLIWDLGNLFQIQNHFH